jgi:hypothetical protein
LSLFQELVNEHDRIKRSGQGTDLTLTRKIPDDFYDF